MDDIVLGVDIGTSGCKVIAVDSTGNILESVMVPYTVKTPHSGWAEQNPEDWFKAFTQAVQKVMEKASISPRNVKAIGIDGMMNSPIFLNRELKPIRPCILWLDQRGQDQVSLIERLFRAHNIVSPLPITPVVALAKILWVIRREPRTWEKTFKIVLPKDYVRLKLTGTLATDPSDASATLLFDGKKYQWAEYLREIFKINVDKLPEIRPSSETIGFITREGASITGLSQETPVVTGCSDGAADALSAGIIETFDTLIRLGTSGALFLVYDEYVPDDKQRYFILAHAIRGKWLIHQMFPFGIPHKWFFETFYKQEIEYARSKNIDPYVYVEKTLNIKDTEGLLFIPNAGYKEDPSYFYGMFIGIRDTHTKSHFALAILQGLALALKEALEPIVEKFGQNITSIKLIGGGSKSLLLRKIISTMLKSVVIVPMYHVASLGAAILASVGVGIFNSYKEAISKMVKIKYEVHPEREVYKEYERMYRRYRELKRKIFA